MPIRMPKSLFSRPPALVALALVAWVRSGRADEPQKGVAQALFERAKESANHGDWASACAQFAESQRLDPAPGTLLNLADCDEHVGKIAAALEHFQEARALLPQGDFRVSFADG